MPILDIQKRARELGRIRTGSKAANGAPTKLSKFRITSASKPLLEKVAGLYGGDVVEWTPSGGAQQWEVYTNVDRIPIYVPPQPVTQWYEAWTAGGCVHRCDGETDYITGEACDNEDVLHQQSKPTTRLNVVLCEVEGIGFFRLESHGWNAAVELPQAAEFLAQANGYVEGWLALEERVSKTIKDGKPQTRRFLVPIIEIGVTPAQLMAGQGRVGAPEVEGPVARAAIEAPTTPESTSAAAPLPTLDDIEAATAPEIVYSIFNYLTDHQAMTPELDAACKARVAALQAAVDPDGAFEAEVVDDGDADGVWQQILLVAGKRGMTTSQVGEDYAEFSGGVAASTASAAELSAYLVHLADQQVSV